MPVSGNVSIFPLNKFGYIILTEQLEQKDETKKIFQEDANNNDEEISSSDLLAQAGKAATEYKINTYAIKSGDTLESISRTYKIKASTIVESNNLSKDNILFYIEQKKSFTFYLHSS
jgi:LysM repeat protein